jgi:hypothetical protein
LVVRNKCADNKCLGNQYKSRIDEICNDYPVITGVHPGCTTYEEDESELGGVKPQQAIVQPRKDELATKTPVQKVATKNVEKIKQLKLPANFVNSTLYVNYLGQWVDFMSCNKWIGLLLDNKKIESVQGISADGNSGVSIKRPGNPSFGLLFRIEGKEAYLTAYVVGNEVNPIQTPAEHSQMAVLMKSLTNEETMN